MSPMDKVIARHILDRQWRILQFSPQLPIINSIPYKGGMHHVQIL